MKKIFSLCATLIAALAMNATEIQVNPGNGTLRAAYNAATAGDVLILAEGVYNEGEQLSLDKDITIQAAEGAQPEIAIRWYSQLISGAKVTFKGVKFDGALYENATDGKVGASDHCFRSYSASTGEETLTLIDCEICNFPGYIIYAQKSARRMYSCTMKNCYFHDNAKSVVYVETAPGASEPLPLSEVYAENSTFVGLGSSYKAIDLKNSGAEVADAKLRIDHCTFYNYGPVRSEKSTDVTIDNSIFAFPTAGATATTLYAGAAINNCLAYNMSFGEGPTATDCIVDQDPLFADAANGDLTLDAASPAINAGNDGKTLGDSRWYPKSGTAISNTAISAKAVKFIENGQLIIMKNGVKYDITGAIVK